MKIAKDKIATAIALFLTLTIAFTLVALPTAHAQETKKTYAFINAVPNPVGVNQETLLAIGITDALQTAADGWEGLSVTVVKPNGDIETITGIRTDSTGGTGRTYVPTMAGNYTLQTHFPAQWYNYTQFDFFTGEETQISTWYEASDSDKLTLFVNEEPVPYYPSLPLPTEYWMRPINAQLRGWYSISGNWLPAGAAGGMAATGMYGGNYVADGNDEAPKSAHVLWTKPLTLGGITGGLVTGEHAMTNGDAYEGKWDKRIIINGILIYNSYSYMTIQEYRAVDLRTGEDLWTHTFLDNQSIAFGQTLDWESYNMQGVYSYIWVTVGSTWHAFDPYNAMWMFTITNVPMGTTIFGENGRIYRYSIDTEAGRMTLWNMTGFISWEGSWDPQYWTHREYNASTGEYRQLFGDGTWGPWEFGTEQWAVDRMAHAYALNFTFPTGLPDSYTAVRLGDRIIGSNMGGDIIGGSTAPTNVEVWGISLKQGQEGTLLFDKKWQAPAEWAAGNITISIEATSFENGERVMVIWAKETRKLYGFSINTGDFLWETETPEHYLNIYSKDTKIAYGGVFSTGASGIVNCYNATTGKLLWSYHADDPYTEILWNNDWWMGIEFFSNGKIYIGHEEHSPNQPLPRGAPFICLNATTGEVIWRANGLFRQTHWGGSAIIGDSVIATMDTYDQRIYAIGKGPSALTVTAGPEVSVLGSSVILKGLVTDVSPGTQDSALKMRFPNGVPAISDESMSDWMLYVYAQFPRPANAIGVEVTLSVLDSNNNFREIAKVASDADGFYSLNWTPDIPGKYTVYAMFGGSESYWPSRAVTAFAVDEVVSVATPEPTQAPTTMAEQYFLPVSIGLFAAIAIVGAIVVLMLRKK